MQVDLADVIFLVNYLFLGGDEPIHPEWGDVNCDGELDLPDVLYIVNSLFLGGPAPCADC
ncbi:hypothetical protein GF420_02475 [candidate division GN15 bacterium]|nr:hypothetical protein [candidate division GN15 bacterium]